MAPGKSKSVDVHELCKNANHKKLKAAATTENCNQQDKSGRTPLSYATSVQNESEIQGKIKCVEILLDLGADPNLPAKDGFTPLFHAADAESDEMMRLLVSKGADVNHVCKVNDWTPLIWASRRGKARAVPVLIELGARLDMKNSKGRTARVLAERKGFNDVVRCLDKFELGSATQTDAVVAENESNFNPEVETDRNRENANDLLDAAAAVNIRPDVALPTKSASDVLSKLRYPQSKLPGICVIVNVSKYKNTSGFSDRPGSEIDVSTVAAAFKKLHYDVRTLERGVTARDIFVYLSQVAAEDHSRCSAFVCFLMAHGSEGAIYGQDGKPLALTQIQSLFEPNLCPSLEGKPKLFFIQACRQSVQQHLEGSSTQQDSHPVLDKTATPLKADFFVGFANVADSPAYRDTRKGSIFVRTLCNVLLENYKAMHLQDLVTVVNDTVCSTPIPGKPGVYFHAVIEARSHLRKQMWFKADSS